MHGNLFSVQVVTHGCMNTQGETDMFIFAISDVYSPKMTCKIDFC